MEIKNKQSASRSRQHGLRLSALALLLAFSSSTMAAIPFELDGNVGVDTAGKIDWANVNGSGTIGYTGVIGDIPEVSPRGIFTTGGSKDELDIPSWRWTIGNVPDKDDITHAYAAAYNDGGELVVVFGADRFGNTGSAQFGFWFLQDGTFAPNTSNNQFTGHHQAGDKLILVEFTKGGTQPNFGIYEWQANGSMLKIGADTIAECVGGVLGDKNFCGISNKAPTPSSEWAYTPKQGPAGTFPTGSFFEGAINITKTFGETICITDFLVETRSSHEISATLKDFSSHDFNTCGGIEVTKQCDEGTFHDMGDTNAANDYFTYEISGKVTKSGLGAAYNIALSDSPDYLDEGDFTWDDCKGNALDSTDGVLDELGGGEEACYTNTATVPAMVNGQSTNPFTDQMSVTAGLTASTSTGLSDLSDVVTCDKVEIPSALHIVKDCAAEVAIDANGVYASVHVTGSVCNDSPHALYDIQLTDTPAEANATGSDVFATPVDLATGDCEDFDYSYRPKEANDLNGEGTTNPHLVMFGDTITFKSAVDSLGNAVSSTASDPAQCPLCKDEE